MSDRFPVDRKEAFEALEGKLGERERELYQSDLDDSSVLLLVGDRLLPGTRVCGASIGRQYSPAALYDSVSWYQPRPKRRLDKYELTLGARDTRTQSLVGQADGS